MPQLLVEVELVEKIEEPPDVAEEEERTHLKAEEGLCPLVSTPRINTSLEDRLSK